MGTLRLQAWFLRAIFERGLAPKDEALASHVADIDDNTCDRTTVQKWRAGTLKAPSGALFALLDLCKDDRRQQQGILQVLAGRYGFRVVLDEDIIGANGTRLEERLLDAYDRLAGFRRAYQAAVADGVLDDVERAALVAVIDQLNDEIVGMRVLLKGRRTP